MKLANKDISLALKKLGYDGEYRYFHVRHDRDNDRILTISDCEKQRDYVHIYCAAPSLNDVSDWLREKHRLIICVDYQSDLSERYMMARKSKWLVDYGWGYNIHDLNQFVHYFQNQWYATYEESFEAAIQYAISRLL